MIRRLIVALDRALAGKLAAVADVDMRHPNDRRLAGR